MWGGDMSIQATMQPLRFRIKGLDCPDCAASLEKAAQALPEVAQAQLIFTASELLVTPKDGATVEPAIKSLAESLGYEAALVGAKAQPEGQDARAWLRRHRRDLGMAAGGLLMLLAFVLGLLGAPQIVVRVLYGAAIVIGGIYVAKAGWAALWTAHTLDMNALMTIAALGAMVVGEFAEGAMTIFLFSIGELLESYSADRARNAIRKLMELAPDEATVLRDGQEVRVRVEELHLGERILVRPGERVPMDGRILQGRSALNQAPITGESLPVEKGEGEEVFAGSINGYGALQVEVTRLAQDSTIARVTRLVEQAQAERAPSQRFVDRFARLYTPIVVGLAAGVALLPPLLGLGSFSTWLYRALVLLVIACPCALVISTPVTIVSALARAARAGVLIKGGRHLEELGWLRVIAFDKTGTLTQGKPQVVGGACELHADSSHECTVCQDLLAKAAAVEGHSEHALAQAVLDQARAKGVQAVYPAAEDVSATPGMGIEGLVDGHTILVGSHAFCHANGGDGGQLCAQVSEAEGKGQTVVVIKDQCCNSACYLAISDSLRAGVPETLAEVKHAGVERTVMLTGDNPFIAEAIAQKAGIDELHAGLLPEDKVRVVEALQERYGRVAMVGDGVNDAPAMAKASVGIAMGAAGSDTALETADVALMNDDLSRLPFAIRLSRRAARIVRANIAFSLLIKLVFLALAIGGISTLWLAVLADTGASLVVTLNGLRMLAFREGR